jgi:TonB family protein
MSLSTNRGFFITVMSLALAAHGQTQPPASTGLANNPSFGYKVGGGAFRVGGGVSAPIAIFSPDPEYSEEARKAKLQGTCVLWLIVGPDGKPRDIRVARTPLGHGLDERAMESVKKWRFKPAYKDGKPVAVEINVEVNFHLNGKVGIKSELDSAIANYTKTIELKPDDSAAYTGRGEAKRSKSDLDGAIADYTKAIEFNPNFGAAYYSRCWARRATRDDAGADADNASAKRLGYYLTCKN